MDIAKHFSSEAWRISKEAFKSSKEEVVRLSTKENLILSAKALLAAYGFYISARIIYKSTKEVLNLISTIISSRKVSKRSLSDVFVENRNQWVVVTGATSGIGLELAKILNLCNFNLILIGRDEEKLREICEEHNSDLRANLSKYIVIDFAVSPVEKIFEKLDECLKENSISEIKMLINNVGAAGSSPFKGQSFQQVIEELNCNYRSHLSMTFYFENKIKKTRVGDHSGMIFVGSLYGTYPLPAFRTYPYCKHLLHGMGLYIHRAHGVYYDSLVAPISSVVTNLNNPVRKNQPDYTKVKAKQAGMGYISAHDCALHLLMTFGFRSWSACHPSHEFDRIYFPYYAAFFRSRLLAKVNKKSREQKPDQPAEQRIRTPVLAADQTRPELIEEKPE